MGVPGNADDARWMRVALTAARSGHPAPNPHVGAVVVANGRKVSTGYHRRAGEAHAEVMALSRAGEYARDSTLYVTFEPCNHYGRTGPCTEAIINAGVRRVVVGARDPAPHVSGSTKRLRSAGIEVTHGVLESQAQRLVADFVKHFRTGVPYVVAKTAATLDGKTADSKGHSMWITGPNSRREVHRMRAYSDAVMVGVGTVLADDPALNVRHVKGQHPARVILDTRLRTPVRARLFSEPGGAVVIFHGKQASPSSRKRLERAGAELVCVPELSTGLSLSRVMTALGKRGLVRLLAEGGATLQGALADGGWLDEICVFTAPKLLMDGEAVPMFRGKKRSLRRALSVEVDSLKRIGDDMMWRGVFCSPGMYWDKNLVAPWKKI